MPSRIKLRAAIVAPLVIATVVIAVVAAGLAGLGGRKQPAAIPAQCPSYTAREAPFAPPLSAARTHFVPFAPTAVLLCFYADSSEGHTPASVSLAQEVLITDAAVASRLAADLDAAAQSSDYLNRGIVNCGVALLQSLDAYFQGDGRSIQVRITGLPGCSGATNGPKNSALGNSDIVSELQGLLGYDRWPGLP